MVCPILPNSLYATMTIATVESLRVVHIYKDYAMIHDVDTDLPQTPIYSIVKMSNGNADDIEYHQNDR